MAEFRPFTVAGKLPVLISELFGSGWTVLQVSCVFIHTVHGQWDSLIDKADKRVDLGSMNNSCFYVIFYYLLAGLIPSLYAWHVIIVLLCTTTLYHYKLNYYLVSIHWLFVANIVIVAVAVI